MSRLEEQAKPVIKSLIRQEATLDKLSRAQRHVLARWAGKTAIVESHAVAGESPIDGKLLLWMREHENGEPGRFASVAYHAGFDAVGHLHVGIIRDLIGGGSVAGNIIVITLPRLILICAFPLPELRYECRCDLSVLHPLWPDAAWKPIAGQLSAMPQAGSDSDTILDTVQALAERIELSHSLK